jgi:dCMP deaminase
VVSAGHADGARVVTDRPSLDETFIKIAGLWALRSTCDRANIGAVLARDGRHVASGYNGAPPGMRHCDHRGGTDDPNNCTRANHAERNVIAFAARYGVSTNGATLYATHSPCLACGLELIAAGITRLVFDKPYRISDPGYSGVGIMIEAGVDVTQHRWEDK